MATINGTAGDDTLNGTVDGGDDDGDGDDVISGAFGDDTLTGGNGADTITGGAGRDTMSGGADSDSFVFAGGDFGGATRAEADRITDFASGDRIDLSAVDASSLSGGDQAFTFLGTGDFTHSAGELRYEQINGNTYLSGDTNGDGLADFMIKLDGLHALSATDLIL